METVLSYGLAIVAVGVMAAAVLKTLASNLKYIYTRPLLINSLRANANHTEVLCKSSPETYFAAVGEAIKTAAMMRSQDPKVLPSATAPAYDAAGKGVVAKWTTLLGKAKLGVMAAAGALALPILKSSSVPPIPVIVLAVAVGIGYLWLFLFKAEIERCIIRARAEILPEVDSAFVAGRYVFPPLPPT